MIKKILIYNTKVAGFQLIQCYSFITGQKNKRKGKEEGQERKEGMSKSLQFGVLMYVFSG